MDATDEGGSVVQAEASPQPKVLSKRVFPLEFKLRLVEETLKPGASVAMIARRNDVNANVLFTWRKLYKAGLLGGGAPSFVQVGVTGGHRPLPAPAAHSAVLVELELSCGILLRVDSRIEEAALSRVLRAVKSSA